MRIRAVHHAAEPADRHGAVVYVLLPLRAGQQAPGFDVVLRAMQAVKPWVMVEVFMLGVLVAFVKLNGLASVIPGPGLWAFGGVMILAAAMASAFDHETCGRRRREFGHGFARPCDATALNGRWASPSSSTPARFRTAPERAAPRWPPSWRPTSNRRASSLRKPRTRRARRSA